MKNKVLLLALVGSFAFASVALAVPRPEYRNSPLSISGPESKGPHADVKLDKLKQKIKKKISRVAHEMMVTYLNSKLVYGDIAFSSESLSPAFGSYIADDYIHNEAPAPYKIRALYLLVTDTLRYVKENDFDVRPDDTAMKDQAVRRKYRADLRRAIDAKYVEDYYAYLDSSIVSAQVAAKYLERIENTHELLKKYGGYTFAGYVVFSKLKKSKELISL